MSHVTMERVSVRQFAVLFGIDIANNSLSVDTNITMGVALNTTSNIHPTGNSATIKLTTISGLGDAHPVNAISRTNIEINPNGEQLIATEIRHRISLPLDILEYFRYILGMGNVVMKFEVVVKWHLKRHNSKAIFDHRETRFRCEVFVTGQGLLTGQLANLFDNSKCFY